MLIRDAEIWGGPRADLRLVDGRIAAIGQLSAHAGERAIDAGGAALLPGLHDHHIHLASTAVARQSVRCGPPEVNDEAGLAAALDRPGTGWLRGIGYDERILGLPHRRQLDALCSHRPVRIQDRTGRMWFLNSRAITLLLDIAAPPAGLERIGGEWTGRLFDEDSWLRKTLSASPPGLAELGRDLAQAGVTGVTDLSPANDAATLDWLAGERTGGRMPQSCLVGGTQGLTDGSFAPGLACGPFKLHLHENALPDLDHIVAQIALAHRRQRAVAIHCTSETELVFALAALRAADAMPGDRIEHAGIATDELIGQVAALGLHVVSQPHFIDERGDRYRETIAQAEWPWLYRLRSFLAAGVTLAAGSDAPYGSVDPWIGIRAATTRTTRLGQSIGPHEALTPEEALGLYLGDPHDLSRTRTLAVGQLADLCLLDRPWAQARGRMVRQDVRATWIAGNLVHDRIDQAPFERRRCAETAA
jgi:predicted amidohydrolase YtcJ